MNRVIPKLVNENKIFNQRARCKEKYSIEIYDR